jgi:hypothetical protein
MSDFLIAERGQRDDHPIAAEAAALRPAGHRRLLRPALHTVLDVHESGDVKTLISH